MARVMAKGGVSLLSNEGIALCLIMMLMLQQQTRSGPTLHFLWLGKQQEHEEGRNSRSKDRKTCDNSDISYFPSPKMVKVRGGGLPGKHSGNKQYKLLATTSH